MVNGAKGGTFDPQAAIEAEDTPLRRWAESLTPSFLGRVSGGWYGCLITLHENERFIWAFGWGESKQAAHASAIPLIMEQRMRSVILIPEV